MLAAGVLLRFVQASQATSNAPLSSAILHAGLHDHGYHLGVGEPLGRVLELFLAVVLDPGRGRHLLHVPPGDKNEHNAGVVDPLDHPIGNVADHLFGIAPRRVTGVGQQIVDSKHAVVVVPIERILAPIVRQEDVGDRRGAIPNK